MLFRTLWPHPLLNIVWILWFIITIAFLLNTITSFGQLSIYYTVLGKLQQWLNLKFCLLHTWLYPAEYFQKKHTSKLMGLILISWPVTPGGPLCYLAVPLHSLRLSFSDLRCLNLFFSSPKLHHLLLHLYSKLMTWLPISLRKEKQSTRDTLRKKNVELRN